MKKLLDNLNLYDMDNINDVRVFIKQYEDYRRDIGTYSSDIDVLPSVKFRQIFIAHNLYDTFRVYNSWDFKEDIICDFVSEYMNNDDYDNDLFIKRLLRHFPLINKREEYIN